MSQTDVIDHERGKDDSEYLSSSLSSSHTDGIDHERGKDDSEDQPLSPQLAEDDYHLKSSIPSGIAFLIGSSLYLDLSRMDLVDTNYYYGNIDDDYEYDEVYDEVYDDDYYYNKYVNKYFIMSIFGAIFLVCNALWEIYWCFGREREWKESINAGYESDDEEENEAYRREERQNLSSALAFGAAASIDLVAAFIPNYKIGAQFYVVSAHMYLLSAILALRGTVLSCPSIPIGLALAGDILFALGSLIDVTVSLISDPFLFQLNDIILAQWSCVSSILWLTDALLYFAADIIVVWYRYTRYREQRSVTGGDKQYELSALKTLT